MGSVALAGLQLRTAHSIGFCSQPKRSSDCLLQSQHRPAFWPDRDLLVGSDLAARHVTSDLV